METYSGRCHCGKVSFSFENEKIGGGVRCNCSICTKKGVVMSEVYVPPERFLQFSGEQALTKYLFGDRLVNHYFCKHCGVYPFHEAVAKPGHYRINLGCIDGIDPFSLAVRWIDGKSF